MAKRCCKDADPSRAPRSHQRSASAAAGSPPLGQNGLRATFNKTYHSHGESQARLPECRKIRENNVEYLSCLRSWGADDGNGSEHGASNYPETVALHECPLRFICERIMGGWLDSYHSAGQPQPPIICLNGFDAPDQKKTSSMATSKTSKISIISPMMVKLLFYLLVAVNIYLCQI